MSKKNLILIPFAIPLIVLDVALVLTGKITLTALLSTLGMFAVVVSVHWFFNIRGQRVERDERTIRLTRKALSYSWLFTIYVVVLLSASYSLGLLRLSGLQSLGIITMVMTFSYLILHLVLNRTGGVE